MSPLVLDKPIRLLLIDQEGDLVVVVVPYSPGCPPVFRASSLISLPWLPIFLQRNLRSHMLASSLVNIYVEDWGGYLLQVFFI